MLTLPLAPTDDRAKPAFTNPATCEQWLSKLQFTNLHAVHNLIRTQLDELNRYPMRVLERLNTLEKSCAKQWPPCSLITPKNWWPKSCL